MNEENTSAQKGKAINKPHSKKNMGTLQTYNKSQIRKHLLHMRSYCFEWKQSTDGTYVGKSQCGCIFEVRFTDTPNTMRSVQLVSRGKGCRFLQANGRGNWTECYACARKRQASNGKSNGSLHKNTS